MTIYNCAKCGKEYTKKTDYTRHMNRKIDCSGITLDMKIEFALDKKLKEKQMELIATQDVESTKILMSLVDRLHDIMRNRSSIIGRTALHDIVRLLMLRFIQPYVKPDGVLNYILDEKLYQYTVRNFKSDDLELLQFDKLASKMGTETERETNLDKLWQMMHQHRISEMIFKEKSFFHCNYETLAICITLIHKMLQDVHFDDFTTDVKGKIYENFINNYAGNGGKDFGQYFTPRNLISRIFEVNNLTFPEMKAESIYDPCAGTGGFLTAILDELNINPEEIYGGEIEPDTFTICLMNLILKTGSICNVKNQNSFYENSKKKYDWIATNPPFGMKGLKHEEICAKLNIQPETVVTIPGQTPAEKDYLTAKQMYPIKCNDGSALFLQHCMAKLKYNGVCNIVLPDGQVLSGKPYIKLRKHLVNDYCLQAILQVPGGAFQNAGVQTAVLFFSKHKRYNTGDVTFYETDKECKTLKKLGVVDFSELPENHNYTFSWKYYKPRETVKLIDSTWEVRTLGEICEFVNGKVITKAQLQDGPYPVIGGGQSPMGSHNEFNREENTILCSSSGAYSGFISMYETKVWASDCIAIIPKDDIHNMYLYHFLISIQDYIYTLQTGAGQPHVNKESLSKIEIPIPSLEKQEEIIKYCEKYNSDIEFCKHLICQLKEYATKCKQLYVDPLFKGEVRTLGEICTLEIGGTPSRQIPEYFGGDNVWVSIKDLNGGIITKSSENITDLGVSKSSVKLIKKDSILMSFLLSIGKTAIAGCDLYTNQAIVAINSKTHDVTNKYIYLYLSNNDVSKDSYGMIGNGGLNKVSLSKIEIPIPSLEEQEEIIKEYERVQNTFIKNTYDMIKLQEDSIDKINEMKKELFTI